MAVQLLLILWFLKIYAFKAVQMVAFSQEKSKDLIYNVPQIYLQFSAEMSVWKQKYQT